MHSEQRAAGPIGRPVARRVLGHAHSRVLPNGVPRLETPRSRSAHECRRVPRPLSAASRLIASAPEGVASRDACHVHVGGGARGEDGGEIRQSRGPRGAEDRGEKSGGRN